MANDDHTQHHDHDHVHGPIDWKLHGVKVIPGDQLDTNTAQTPGMNRAAAINMARVGAQKIWAGTVHIHANAKTGAHHHGALESVIFVLKGRQGAFTTRTIKSENHFMRVRGCARNPFADLNMGLPFQVSSGSLLRHG